MNMTSIIKNQLLKHLSRYTKNLSSDKINLSTFRGEGELSNLQLDEDVLTELLELPSWLRLTSAWCNHVAFRIHWTKLKSTPITLTLDEVRITIETCEVGPGGVRTPTPQTPGLQSLTGPQGKYSFINKVIDGITVVVNNVNVKFISPAFTASIQMSRIRVESKTPKWLLGDLRVTRLKDPTQGLILIFKELSWQTVRIEASSTQEKNLTPLRLLTNQARCRITIKKRLSDCSVLSSRLVLILDDLLWVLTDSQLKAALHFVDSLAGLIKQSTDEIQRKKAQRKLQTLPEYQALLAQQARPNEPHVVITAAQKSFNAFDVKETSYHFFSQRIDLHLCDDADGRSCYPSLKNGGALQISVQGFQVDYYPYHLAKATRTNWPKYKEANCPPALWLEQSLQSFREALFNLANPNRPSSHAPLERTPNFNQDTNPNSAAQSTTTTPSGNTTPQHSMSSPMKKHVLDNLSKLMTSCIIMRIEDFTLYRVTTSGRKQMPKEFITGDKERYSFPPEMPALHAEFTYFYYPGDFVFPLPPSKAYVHINPVAITFDMDSCLWLNSFALNLHESLSNTSVGSTLNSPTKSPIGQTEPSFMYMDVKLEAIMPRITFESSNPETSTQRDRPKLMTAQISRFAISNIREMGSSRADLAQALHAIQEGSLVFASDFPSRDDDMCIVTDRLLSHVSGSDVIPLPPLGLNATFINTPFSNLTRYALWVEPRDVWCIKFDPVWVDFYGARSIGPNRAIPFIDAVPITLWVHGKSEFDTKKFSEQLIKSHHGNTVANNTKRVESQPESLILSVASLQSLDNMIFSSNLADDNIASKQNLYQDEDNQKSSSENTKIPDETEDTNNTADLHVIAHVANLVSVQIDHYQYLFLLRLAEEITEMTTFLSMDAKRITNQETNEKSIIIGCVIPQVEVTLVMPSQTPGKEMSGGDGESVMPDSASLGDDLHLNSSSTMWPTTTPPSLDLLKNSNPFESVESPTSPMHNEATFDMPPGAGAIHHTPTPNTHGYNVQIQAEPVPPKTDTSIKSESIASSTTSKSKNRNSASDSTISKEINSGLASMKKGFTSFMTSFELAVKPSDDMSDTISIQSDLSSDSENFIMVLDSDKTTDHIDGMFRLNPFTNDPNLKASPVEVASEVYEEVQNYKTNMSSPSEPSEASSCKRRDLVSMVTFRLTTVEFIRQNRGYSSSIRAQVSAINCDECGAIPWDEFQSKFGTRCRAWNIAPHNPEAPPVVKLRFEEELKPPTDLTIAMDRKSVLSWFSHNADVQVKGLNIQLAMSTIIGLGDLAEDEIIAKPLSLDALLENITVNIIEDRPPVNITSPGSVPLNLVIGKLRCTRDETGVFNIQPETSLVKAQSETSTDDGGSTPKRERDRDREILALQLVMQQVKFDNDGLKRNLAAMEKNVETTKNKAKQENEILKSYLKAAQDDISTLLDEKRTLLDTVRSLQQQLSSYETVYKNDGSR